MQINTIIHGDVTDKLRCLPDESINCVVTSPPYWGLRDYGAEGQLGLEETPQEYVAKLVAVFREIKRVLTDDGTVWLNLGDSYSQSGKRYTGRQDNGRPEKNRGWREYDIPRYAVIQDTQLKPKNLIGLPWRVAFALQDDGWYLRNDIIWHKLNTLPESVTDRCTKAHEYVFLLTKSARYWFDQEAIREKSPDYVERRIKREKRNGLTKSSIKNSNADHIGLSDSSIAYKQVGARTPGRNARTVWSIATKPYKGSHFAVMPPELARRCIVAGCPSRVCVTCGAAWVRKTDKIKGVPDSYNGSTFTEGKTSIRVSHLSNVGQKARTLKVIDKGHHPTCACNASHKPGIVLDPFFGAGTTGVVAQGNGRHWLGIELNQEYISLAWQRIKGSKISLPGIF